MEEVDGAGGNGGAGCVGMIDIVNVPPNRGIRDAALLRERFDGGGLRLFHKSEQYIWPAQMIHTYSQ